MKKLFALLVCVLLVFALASCGDDPCQHRDADDNSLCDKCGESYTDGNDLPDEHTHSYTVKNTDNKYLDKAADCENAATYFYSCSCGDKGADVFIHGDKLGHLKHSYEAKEPTCTTVGWYAYVACDRTGCGYTTKIEREKLDHEYSEELRYNATHHYHECKCGAKNDEAEHVSSGSASATNNEVCTECGYVINVAVGISFKTLTVTGSNVYGEVSNDTEQYSFINEVMMSGGAKYIVSTNVTGTGWIPAKTIDLATGDNTVYVIEMIDDEPSQVYTVVIRRRPVYEVRFNTAGGTTVETQYVEEDSFATEPTTTRAGYTFTGWDYDFSASITSDIHITASWKANTDTKYTVEYYLENLDKTDYELIETDELTETTDTTVEALVKEFEHFTPNTANSVTSGNVDGNGHLVLKVYYVRNVYTLSNANADFGSISASGSFAYGSLFEVTATVIKLGYEFVGWYSEGGLVSTDSKYTFTAERSIEARFALKPEMAIFNFTSTATTCSINGIIDKTVTEITVPEYVTSIGSSAFSGCSSLEGITLPFVGGSKSATNASSSTLFGYIFGTSSYTGGVSTKQYYGSDYSTYYIPSSLKSVTITGGNILYGAFYDCDSLTSVTIPGSVTSIGNYAFCYCKSLTSVTIGDGVTSIGSSAFYSCDSLASVTIPGNVTSIGSSAFYNCDSLTSVTIPGNVTSIGDYAFYNCDSLTSVVIPDSVTDIGSNAFRNCTSLMNITVSANNSVYKDIDGNLYTKDGKTLIQYAVGKTATSFTIPDSVTSIGSRAFSGCTSLTSVTIPGNVTSIGSSAFYSCNRLTSITLPFVGASKYGTSNTHFGYIFGASSYSDNYDYVPSSLKTVIITGGERIVSGAFAYCSLTSVTIPGSVTSIGSSAFYSCNRLTSVVIPDSVTSIGNSAFYNCYSLTSVTIGNGVKSIGSEAFRNCTSLTSVTIPGSVTSIGECAFLRCTSLTSVTVGDNCAAIISSNAFLDCNSSLYTVYENCRYVGDTQNPYAILIGVTNANFSTYKIHQNTKIIASSAFSSCELSTITIPDSVTSIGDDAFYSCDSLTSVTIPGSVTNIGDYAFYNCTSLTSVTIPGSVTNIGDYAFYNCTSLTSVTIGDGVTSIRSSAFSDCTSLTSIKYRGTEEQWNAISKGSRWDEYYLNGNYYRINYTITYNYEGE